MMVSEFCSVSITIIGQGDFEGILTPQLFDRQETLNLDD